MRGREGRRPCARGCAAAEGGPSAPRGDETPLVVDVDGTLVQGNLLIEGLSQLLARRPSLVLALLPWLLRGRAYLKRKVAEAAPPLPEGLVRNPQVASEIEAAREVGRPVHLATGADARAAAPLAAATGVAGVFASDGSVNLVGPAKAEALVAAFGQGGFDYIGDEGRDLPVWRCARRAVGVGLSGRLRARVRAIDSQARFLPGAGGGFAAYVEALRPAHWSKNMLLFVPLLAAHETDLASWLVVLGLFLAFSALVSGTYVVNDLLDLPHDRRHVQKRHRPLASGRLRPGRALGVALALLAAGLAAAFALSTAAGLCLLGYLLLTLAYTLVLKRQLFLDVIVLGGLFVLRVFAGAVAAAVPISAWLAAFALFLFLSLAIAKRTTGLRDEVPALGGRGYVARDAGPLTVLGGASAFAAVLVLALYIQSPDVAVLYERPAALWLAVPLLIYWLGRLMLLANRGVLDDDPIVFAVRDPASWLMVLGLFGAFALALP